MLVCILFSTFLKPNKKYISSLRLRSNYPTSAVLEGYSLRRVLMPNTARAPRINEIPAITSITI